MRILLAVVIMTFCVDMAFSWGSSEAKSVPIPEAFYENWKNLFDILDTDGDGIYTVEECHFYLQQLMDYYHPSRHLVPGLNVICRFHSDVIEAYFGMDTAETGLTKSEYAQAYGWYWSNHFKLYKHRVHSFFTALFHTIDSDNDGTVSFEEFQHYYIQPLGDSELIKKKVRQLFNHIDTDDNGVIAEDEFVGIYLRYRVTADINAKEIPFF